MENEQLGLGMTSEIMKRFEASYERGPKPADHFRDFKWKIENTLGYLITALGNKTSFTFTVDWESLFIEPEKANDLLSYLATYTPDITVIINAWCYVLDDKNFKHAVPKIKETLNGIHFAHDPKCVGDKAIVLELKDGIETVKWAINMFGWPIDNDALKENYKLWFLPEDMGAGMTPELFHTFVDNAQFARRPGPEMLHVFNKLLERIKESRKPWDQVVVEAPRFIIDWKSLLVDPSKSQSAFQALIEYEPNAIEPVFKGAIIFESNWKPAGLKARAKVDEIRLIHDPSRPANESGTSVELLDAERRLEVTWNMQPTSFPFKKQMKAEYQKLFP